MKKRPLSWLGVFLLGFFAFGLSGCKEENKLIERAEVRWSDNLEALRVALVFGSRVAPSMGGIFPVGAYGSLFVSPKTSTEAFQIGFDLSTDIVNDQDYVKLEPSLYLPIGIPHGIDHPLVRVDLGDAANLSEFDASAWVDVQKGEWVGASIQFHFEENEYFPPGLIYQQALQKNGQGSPTVLAHVYGAMKNPDGSLKSRGGIAVFANIRELR